eukprot:7390931-Prymnesium_polylepis.1
MPLPHEIVLAAQDAASAHLGYAVSFSFLPGLRKPDEPPPTLSLVWALSLIWVLPPLPILQPPVSLLLSLVTLAVCEKSPSRSAQPRVGCA